MKKLLLASAFALSAFATQYPLEYENCGVAETLDKKPTRAVVNDINMIDMAVALGIEAQLAGVSGINNKFQKDDIPALKNVPELSLKYPPLEVLLDAKTDLYVAGWSYGMKVGGDVTPDILRPHGIKTFILRESCVRVDPAVPAADIDRLLYADILKLGKLFDKEQKAQELVDGWKKELASTLSKIKNPKPIKVMLFDSPGEKGLIAAKHAMPSAIIAAVGAKNVMDDMEGSWVRSSYEDLATRQAEFYIVVEYKPDSYKKTIEFLEEHPLMSQTPGVKNKRYLPLRYAEITPGPKNIEAALKLAKALYPEDF